jgi:hypothetical protein
MNLTHDFTVYKQGFYFAEVKNNQLVKYRCHHYTAIRRRNTIVITIRNRRTGPPSRLDFLRTFTINLEDATHIIWANGEQAISTEFENMFTGRIAIDCRENAHY